jgi:hypothetical protein
LETQEQYWMWRAHKFVESEVIGLWKKAVGDDDEKKRESQGLISMVASHEGGAECGPLMMAFYFQFVYGWR